MIRGLLHAQDPQILGATVQNLLAWVSWRLGFVHRCLYIDKFQVSLTQIVQNIAFWVLTPLICVDIDVSVKHFVSIVRVRRSGAVFTLK